MGADLPGVTQNQLNYIDRLRNGRPRKTLGWKSPNKVMTNEIANFHLSVALGI